MDAGDGHEQWTIGEFAERARTTVKTVRFYSDRGLLPEASRSVGGHRRYGPEALERLLLIRRLRALDLPLPVVARVVDEEDSLEDVLAAQLHDVGGRIAALRWREAALQSLQGCPPGERVERLRLLAAVAQPPTTDSLARFWRRRLPVRMPRRLLRAIVDAAVPQPPAEPTPDQALAFARLHELAEQATPALAPPHADCDAAGCYEGLGVAYELAAAELRDSAEPGPGAALDCFVAVHAESRGRRDGDAFRSGLLAELHSEAEPVMERYWTLTDRLADPLQPTMGAAHAWLTRSLETSVRPAG